MAINRYYKVTPVIALGVTVIGPVRDMCPELYPEAFEALSPPYVNYSPQPLQTGWTFLASGQNSIASTEVIRGVGHITIANQKFRL